MSTLHVAIAVVRDDQDRFLVGRRAPGVVLAGFHEFPGGKVASNEAAATAAARECGEETGMLVTVGECLMRVEHDYDHARVRLEFFACEPQDEAAEPLIPYDWVPRDQLPLCDFPAANAVLIDALMDGLFSVAE